jgi:hypothetical protein
MYRKLWERDFACAFHSNRMAIFDSRTRYNVRSLVQLDYFLFLKLRSPNSKAQNSTTFLKLRLLHAWSTWKLLRKKTVSNGQRLGLRTQRRIVDVSIWNKKIFNTLPCFILCVLCPKIYFNRSVHFTTVVQCIITCTKKKMHARTRWSYLEEISYMI